MKRGDTRYFVKERTSANECNDHESLSEVWFLKGESAPSVQGSEQDEKRKAPLKNGPRNLPNLAARGWLPGSFRSNNPAKGLRRSL